MLVALIAKDKPGHLETRKANREKHLEYMKETGLARHAGPLLDSDGNMCGSLVVLEVDTMTQAEEWAKNDPYNLACLFQSAELIQWNKLI